MTPTHQPPASATAAEPIPGLTPNPDAQAWAALNQGAALASIPGPVAIDIHGKDAADYLHRRLAQSVRKLPVGRGVQALQLAGDGRMEADLLLYRTGDARFVALVDPAHAESTAALIDKYVLMDAVEVIPPAKDDATLTLLGPRASAVLGDLLGTGVQAQADADAWSCCLVHFEDAAVSIFRDGRGSLPVFVLRAPRPSLDRLASSLRDRVRSCGGAVAGPAVLEYFRLARGIPRFGVDTTSATIPLESNLRDALDLAKGCFPGQEFLARINNLGHPARVLARLRFDAAAAPAVGDAVHDPAGALEGEGSVTSVQFLEGIPEGLAFAVLPWKLRELRGAAVTGGDRRLTAAVELLGEYPDASGARRSI